MVTPAPILIVCALRHTPPAVAVEPWEPILSLPAAAAVEGSMLFSLRLMWFSCSLSGRSSDEMGIGATAASTLLVCRVPGTTEETTAAGTVEAVVVVALCCCCCRIRCVWPLLMLMFAATETAEEEAMVEDEVVCA